MLSLHFLSSSCVRTQIVFVLFAQFSYSYLDLESFGQSSTVYVYRIDITLRWLDIPSVSFGIIHVLVYVILLRESSLVY